MNEEEQNKMSFFTATNSGLSLSLSLSAIYASFYFSLITPPSTFSDSFSLSSIVLLFLFTNNVGYTKFSVFFFSTKNIYVFLLLI
jgi:hypothetical protein